MKKLLYLPYFLSFVLSISLSIESKASYNKFQSEFINLKETGDNHYLKREYSDALNFYLKAIENKIDSGFTESLSLKIAMCYFYNKEYDKCLEYFKKSNEINPELTDYINYFSLLCYRNLGDSVNVWNLINTFKKNYKGALLIDDVLIIEGELLREKGRYSESNELLILLLPKLKDNEKLQKILVYISNGYIQIKEYDKAIFYLKKIINDYPFEPISINALNKIINIKTLEGKTLDDEEILLGISLYISQREYQKAYKFYEEYSPKIERKKVNKQYEKGRILYYIGKYDESLEIFNEIFSKYINSEVIPNTMIFIARCYLSKEDIERSIKEYIVFTKFFPRNNIVSEIFWKIGWIYEGKKDYKNAVKFYTLNTKSDNTYSILSLWRIGFCYYKMKMYQNAIDIFESIIIKKNVEQRLRDSSIYWKAKSFEKNGNFEDYKKHLEMLISSEIPNYYTFKAAEKLNYSITLKSQFLEEINTKNVENKGMNDYPEIKKGIIVGEIFGNKYGEQILDYIRIKYINNYIFLKSIKKVYEDHGIFSKAIRVSITIRELYRSGEKSFDNLESVLMMSYPRYYKEEMEKIIIGEEIESSVIYSIMRRESAFDKDAISSAGAVGLLQLLPENGYKTAKKINKKIVWNDLKNPEINILLGYEYFKSLLQRYNGNYVIAFASYNAGVNNVDNWIGKYGLEDVEEFIENIEFSETRDYVKAVLEGWWIYKKLYES